MRSYLAISIVLLTGSIFGQIDTRISPASPPPRQVETDSGATQESSESKSKRTPLVGFLNESLGSSGGDLESTFAASEVFSNKVLTHEGYGVDENTRLIGTMSLHHAWDGALLLMQYAGGSDFYVKNSYLNEQFHQLETKQAIRLGRWNISLGQNFNYLPQSSFGFNPAHLLGNDVSSGDTNSAPGAALFLPANIIERTISSQANIEYVIGARSAASFSGKFSDLRFSGAAPGVVLADSETFSAGAQYGYALDRSNTIGARYIFEQGRALGFGSLIQAHSAMGTYKREFGPHFIFRVSAGPQFTSLNQNGTDITLGTSSRLTASATWLLGRANLGALYFHGINPGSGLFLGSKGDDLRVFIGRKFGLTMETSIAAGYSRNKSLGTPTINAARRIDSTYVTTGLERSLGPLLSAFMSYSFQKQNTDSVLCNGRGCTRFPSVHSATIGLRFHIHPFTLRP